MRWTDACGRPDKIGKLQMVTRLKVNEPAADGRHLFRLDEWQIALIASEEAKRVLEEVVAVGLIFQPV